MELNAQAFSPEGYIIRQWQTNTVTFGSRPSGENGCGWIAAYNVLRATLNPVPWQKVFEDLSRQLMFGGRRGLQLGALVGYLRQQGCRMWISCTLTGSRLLAKKCRAGVVMYSTGHSSHYVAFVGQADGQLRFLNVAPGKADVTMTLREFYRETVHFPVMVVVGVL